MNISTKTIDREFSFWAQSLAMENLLEIKIGSGSGERLTIGSMVNR